VRTTRALTRQTNFLFDRSFKFRSFLFFALLRSLKKQNKTRQKLRAYTQIELKLTRETIRDSIRVHFCFFFFEKRKTKLIVLFYELSKSKFEQSTFNHSSLLIYTYIFPRYFTHSFFPAVKIFLNDFFQFLDVYTASKSRSRPIRQNLLTYNYCSLIIYIFIIIVRLGFTYLFLYRSILYFCTVFLNNFIRVLGVQSDTFFLVELNYK